MANLSSFYPQPVVKGTTAGTYAEGNDSRIVGALPAATAGTGSVLASGSTTARTLSNRFADEINVLDYGADPTGVNDSWLAIQRAIFDSGLDPANRIASTISASETTTYGNRTLLRLYRFTGFGSYTVRIPNGTYKISKPLVIGQGMHITGHEGGNSTTIVMDNATHGQFTAITDSGWILASDESASVPFDFILANYNHGCVIENLQITTNYPANQSGLIAKDYYWVKWYFDGASYATVTGSSGSTELTSTYGFNYWREGKIKLYPSNQILDIQYAQDNKIYLKNPLSQNVTAENYAFGIAKHNGIWISGGEGSRISNVWCNQLLGSGIHILSGSPNPIIENTMMNFCDVAYLIEDAPAVLIKPSGDCNNVILQCKGFTNTTLISGKFEDPRPLTGPYSNPNIFVPYPNLTSCRAIVEVEGLPSGTPTFLNINGLTQNASGSNTLNISCVDIYEHTLPAIVKVDGLRSLGYGSRFARRLSLGGVVQQVYARENSFINDDERSFYSGSSPYLASPRENFNGGQTLLTFASRSGSPQSTFQTGITLDIQNSETKHMSGRLPNRCNFSRSGTTATITYRNSANNANANHGLKVGDMVYFGGYTFTTGSGNLAWNNNSNDGAFPPTFTIKTVPTSETFTITVANSGATVGSANLHALQYAEFHTIIRDEHRFQIPNTVGNQDLDYRGFSIYDRKKDVVASLAVPSVDKGTWWIKDQFAAGGTVASPSVRILHGADAPSISAPNGSLYLRTDGAADTTLYVRAASAWTALTST